MNYFDFTARLLASFTTRMVVLFLIGLSAPLTAQEYTGLSFDGSNDHVTLDGRLNDELSSKRQLTLEVRVTFDALKSFDPIFSFNDSRGSKKAYTFDLLTSGGGGKFFATNVSNGQEDMRVATETPIVVGREYLLSLVFDGLLPKPQDRTQLYIDGVRQNLTGGEHAPTLTSSLENTPIYLGRENNRYSQITLSELRLWNTARTEEEIVALAGVELAQVSGEGIIAAYAFNKDSRETDLNLLNSLEEGSGSGYTGTLNNFALTGGSSTWVGMMAVMPVDLVAFTGRVSGDNNRLEWTVVNERNFSHYEVERSVSGTENWVTMEEFLAEATEETGEFTYRFEDLTTASAYYRLRMIDLDGTSTLSEVVFLERKNEGSFEVYPNPAIDHVTVTVPAQERVYLQLTDASGRRVWTKELPAGTATQAHVATDAAPGLYILTARTQGQSWSQRLVIN